MPSRERSETRLLAFSVNKAGKRSNVTYRRFELTLLRAFERGTEGLAELPTPGGLGSSSTELSARAHRPHQPESQRRVQYLPKPPGPNFGTPLSGALPDQNPRARDEGAERSVRRPTGQPSGRARGPPRCRQGPRGRRGRGLPARGARGRRPPLNACLCGPCWASLPCRRRRGCGPRRRPRSRGPG